MATNAMEFEVSIDEVKTKTVERLIAPLIHMVNVEL
jgi:hypothetical protein